jgi:hypothetical protein
MNAKRYVVAAGLAASEVGALMALQTIIALLTGAEKVVAASVVDVLLLAGLGVWLWWRRSPVPAGLVLALIALEYWYLASTTGRGNTWLVTYLVVFLIALSVHAQRSGKAV